ncbi:MAG TPA: ABC transporter ATP-binding protein [Stellaceae bacterium]|nr:ABC transporter ATP-binding protein [Stellaceae bacterium]
MIATAAAQPVLSVRGLIKRFGGLVATDCVDFDVMPGEVHGLIGPNGAGKTTFIAQLAGLLGSDAGRIVLCGRDITRLKAPRRAALGLARSYQITSIFPDFTALENVLTAVAVKAGHCFRFWRPVRAETELTARALAILDLVGLADARDKPARALAHGEKRLLDLGIALATEPRLLLLDEPMAGMGAHESAEVQELLDGLRGRFAMVLIEHDMDVVFRLCDRISVMASGRLIASGAPDAIRSNPEVRLAYLGED